MAIDAEKLFASRSQKFISEWVDKSLFNSLLGHSSPSDAARIRSCCGTHGSAVLDAPLATVRGFKLTPQEFTFYASLRLGIPNVSNDGEKCMLCNQSMDPFGTHPVICKTGEFGPVYRHNNLRNIVYTTCQRAAWSPKLEIACLPNTNHTPADIYIQTGPEKCLAVDITIVHPLAKNLIAHSSKEFDHANNFAERKKNTKYSKYLTDKVTFMPLAMEFFGRLSPQFVHFISKADTAIRNRFGGSLGYLTKDIERKLVVNHFRAAFRSALARIPSRIAF